jgi:hypothetical protein
MRIHTVADGLAATSLDEQASLFCGLIGASTAGHARVRWLGIRDVLGEHFWCSPDVQAS